MALSNNGQIWADYVENVYVPHIRLLRETLYERVLPTFDDIHDEAEEYADRVWEELGRRAGPVGDPADVAEAANEAGVERFQALNDVRQTYLNMTAVALHHLLEQQTELLLRRELIPRADQRTELSSHEVRQQFVGRLQAQGVDPAAYEVWPELVVLRHTANTIKHAEGPSERQLRELRPHLFVVPSLRGDDLSMRMAENSRVEHPLAGRDVYVTADDLASFFDAVEAFWAFITDDFYRAAT